MCDAHRFRQPSDRKETENVALRYLLFSALYHTMVAHHGIDFINDNCYQSVVPQGL